MLKEVLGWLCDGKDKTIGLPYKKVNRIVGAIKQMLKYNAGTPSKEFRSLWEGCIMLPLKSLPERDS